MRRVGFWLGVTALWLAVLYQGGRTTALAQATAALSIAVLVVHAILALGRVRAAAFLAICLTVTFAIENLGVATGIPFGAYTFRVAPDLPHVGTIPIIVGPLYFGLGYPAWIIACLLLGTDIGGPANRRELVFTPVVAAFTLTQWDVVMDPANATIGRAWAWFESGGYFGVPLSNFLGWFLTTWLFFQGFALFAYRDRGRSRSVRRSPAFLAVPVLLYAASALCHLPPLLDPDAVVVDAGGRAWSSADIRETAAILALFTMLPVALLALMKLAGTGVAPRAERERLDGLPSA
ncbi:carotenoid biosynthesis protein [Methylorubrum populi]|uniref:carotenoid biosynthesis protein n=1 Tax=Methylorubrum populi TaxID=223967 RepID=UPI003F65E6E7